MFESNPYTDMFNYKFYKFINQYKIINNIDKIDKLSSKELLILITKNSNYSKIKELK